MITFKTSKFDELQQFYSFYILNIKVALKSKSTRSDPKQNKILESLTTLQFSHLIKMHQLCWRSNIPRLYCFGVTRTQL